ncbi:hypothetical protein [Tenacibaculum finnmarkense]|uniref:hypothetical protein n=1 Tax=Tenacibaculum finnmarkense TaxID=2781243 RepID=UPI002300ECC7|nr:hypothetical protein [Tenacibaculum finnmarkense]WCC46231.1 hypothetical protein PJH08_07425 [Tenacibaculum finnmarkense]
MNTKEKLNNLWSKDFINQLPNFIKERGFVFSENNSQKDILITGINPSFRKDAELGNFGFDFQLTLKEEKYDNYWNPLKKIVFDPENSIDLRDKSAYLDIFYFREKEQNKLKKEILKNNNGIRFLVEQLKITQQTIENDIKPKLIIVKNKESAAYWGKLLEKGIIWMGYQLNFVQSYMCGDLYKISGFLESNERISSEITETNLKGSLILFTEHISQYTKKEKRPTAVLINELLKKL